MLKPVHKRTRTDGRRYVLVDESLHQKLAESNVNT
jgi:hypothetical protein